MTSEKQFDINLPQVSLENDPTSISNNPIKSGIIETPETEPEELEKWNSPSINMYRYFATIYSFIIMGMNDAAYGALIPYVQTNYLKKWS